MKILILTQYFPPEVGAPQNRLYELAIRLKEKGADITVLTAMPNYPKMVIHEEYKGKWHIKEEFSGLLVHRSWIYVSRSKSFVRRLLNYFSFVFSSMIVGLFSLGRFDYILCESPPLFLGISAYTLKVFKRSRLIFNVSDLWPESAIVLGFVKNRVLLWTSIRLERFLYRHSELITGQTKGIISNISARFPQKKVYWLPNGVDMSYYNCDLPYENWRSRNKFNPDDFILLYAGLLGFAQGLDVIIHAAEQLKLQPGIKFVVMGDGPEKSRLVALADDLKLENLYFYDAVGKAEIPAVLNSINVSIIPLKKRDLFKGAIPSKIFETLAMKTPVLLGVDGEAKELFIDDAKAGLFFEPENHTDLADKITWLYNNRETVKQLGENGHGYVKKRFTRDSIAENFWLTISELHHG